MLSSPISQIEAIPKRTSFGIVELAPKEEFGEKGRMLGPRLLNLGIRWIQVILNSGEDIETRTFPTRVIFLGQQTKHNHLQKKVQMTDFCSQGNASSDSFTTLTAFFYPPIYVRSCPAYEQRSFFFLSAKKHDLLEPLQVLLQFNPQANPARKSDG